MVRRFIALVVVVVAVMAVASPVLAVKPAGCPKSFTQVDGEGWWAGTVIGIGEAGSTVEEQAELFGFGDDIAAFKAWVIEGAINPEVGGFDKNGNGFICMKDLPNTPGHPGFIFGIRDDRA